MTAAVETPKVTGRRQLHFNSLEDILADVDGLANASELRTLGNWSSGQILKHLALVMNASIDGFPAQLPGIVRFFLRPFFKKRFLSKPMAPGFKVPAKLAALLPPPTSWEEGLQSIREGIRRLLSESKR